MRLESYAVITIFLFLAFALVLPANIQNTSLTGSATHAQFPEFSSNEGRVHVQNAQFSVSDSLIYKIAYFSVNGSPWQSFELSGSSFYGEDDWLEGDTSYLLPENMSGPGEHYVITFSCTINGQVPNCHNTENRPNGFWQLFVINNSADFSYVSPISMSSSSSSLPENLFDNNFSSSWSDYGDGVWVSFDLGDIYSVSAIDMAFFKGDERHAFFEVQISDDGVNWRTVLDAASSGSSLDFERFSFVPSNTKFLRVLGRGNDDSTISSREYNTYTELRVVVNNYLSCGACGDDEFCDDGICKSANNPISSSQAWPLESFNVLWEHDFDENTLGEYDANEAYDDWGAYPENTVLSEIVSDSDGGRSLKVNFPAYADHQGFQVIGSIEPGYDELYYVYQLKFKPKMYFTQGAKLPGLAARSLDGSIPSGGSNTPLSAGFSGRLLFIVPDRIATYMYHHDQPKDFGDKLYFYDDLPAAVDYNEVNKVVDAWHTLVIRAVLNSVPVEGQGANDGIYEVWLDGKLVQQLTTMRFRNYANIDIDSNYFSVFYGGSGVYVQPHRDEWILFDNAKIFTYNTNSLPVGESVPVDLTHSAIDRDLHLPDSWMRVTDIPKANEAEEQRVLINFYADYVDEPPMLIGSEWWNHLGGNLAKDIQSGWHLYTANGEWSGLKLTLLSGAYTQVAGFSGTSYPDVCEASMWRADGAVGVLNIKGFDVGKKYTLKALSNLVIPGNDVLLTFRGVEERIVVDKNTNLAEWSWTADSEEEEFTFVGDNNYGRLNLIEIIEYAN